MGLFSRLLFVVNFSEKKITGNTFNVRDKHWGWGRVGGGGGEKNFKMGEFLKKKKKKKILKKKKKKKKEKKRKFGWDYI